MRDFDPHRIASEWHSGQGSALYAYCSTGMIPSEDFKDRLVWEIEKSMAHANDEGLDELEYLLMQVEEQEPEAMREVEHGKKKKHHQLAARGLAFPVFGSCPRCGASAEEGCTCAAGPVAVAEAWGTVDKLGNEQWSDDDDSDIRDLYNPDVFDDSAHAEVPKIIKHKPEARREEDSLCEICGGSKGMCECTMTEEDMGDKCPECNGPPGKHDPRCSLKHESKGSLRLAVARIMKEMKLGVAGRGNFDFGQKDDDEEVATFLLNKKEKEEEKEAPPAEKSGTKLKTTKKRSKSSQFR